jgi:RNA polymerase sigma factor (sigma-70 family)
MAQGHLGVLITEIRRLAAPPGSGDVSDGELLERFTSRQDATAFAALVHRHGPMVLGACRRVLRQAEDAEDAFQATFLALIRQARSIDRRQSLGGWLYRVAYRAAMKAKRSASRRAERERRACRSPANGVVDEAAGRELLQVLDEELQRLPDKCRELAVLCYLEGRAQAEAARALGVSEATASTRMAQARALLQERLARRGLVFGAGGLAALLGPGQSLAALPVALVDATVQSGLRFLAGEAAGVVSAKVLSLVDGLGKAVFTKAKVLTLLLLTLAAAGGTGIFYHERSNTQASAAETPADPPAVQRAAQTDVKTPPPPLKGNAATANQKQKPPPGTPVITEPETFLTRPVALLAPSNEEILTLAFSADGKRLVGAGAGAGDEKPGQLKIWELPSGKVLASIRPLPSTRTVAFSPKGDVLASGEYGGAIKLRDPASGKELASLKGHAVGVNGLAFAPDGKFLASAGLDRVVKLWDVAGRQEAKTFYGHTDMVTGVAYFRNGRFIVSAGRDKTAKIWDVKTGKERHTLRGHEQFVEAVAVSPDDKLVVTSSGDNTVRFWNAETAAEIATLTLEATGQVPAGYTAGVYSLAFSPDGKFLAGGHADGTIRLWEVRTRTPVATLEKHAGPAWGLAFARDGTLLASGSIDKTVKLWSVPTFQEVSTLPATAPSQELKPVLAVAYAPDGKLLALATEDKTVELRNARTGDLVRVLEGHADVVTCLAFSGDGQMLASGGSDKTIKLWHTDTGKELHTLKGHSGWVHALAFTPDGKKLASGGYDKLIKLWDPATGQDLATLAGHKASVRALAIAPDGSCLAGGGADKIIRVWHLTPGSPSEPIALKGHEGTVRALAFSPAGILASGAEDGTVKLWEACTGKERVTLRGHTSDVLSLAFSRGGRTLVSGSLDKTVIVWDPIRGQMRGVLKGHTDAVTALTLHPYGEHLISGSADATLLRWLGASAHPPLTLQADAGNWFALFSPGGERLATAGSSGMITLWTRSLAPAQQREALQPGTYWDAAFSQDGRTMALATSAAVQICDPLSGEVRRTLQMEQRPLRSVALSPDGKFVAAGTGDFKNPDVPPDIRIFHVATGELAAKLEGHTAMNFRLCFSPDGKTLATACKDNTVRLWDVPSGKPRATLLGHTNRIRGLRFLPDGTLVTASWDGTVRFWDVTTARQVKIWTVDLRLDMLDVNAAGTLLAAAEAAGQGERPSKLKIWDVASGAEKLELQGHDHGIYGLAFARGAPGLVAVGGQMGAFGELHYWDLNTGQLRVTHKTPAQVLQNVALSPDGKRVVAVSTKVLSSWDLNFLHKERTWTHAPDKTVTCGLFTPDGRRLVTGCADGTIKVWQVPGGNLLATLEGHTDLVRGLVLLPDGKTLASASQDTTIRLWDLDTRKEAKTLRGHTRAVYCLALSPDGKTLASGGGDHRQPGPAELFFWDLRTGSQRTPFSGIDRAVWSLSFSPDGNLLAASAAGSVKVWDLKTGSARAAFALPFARPLTFSPDGKFLAAARGIGPSKDAPARPGGGSVHLWDTATWQEQAVLHGHTRVIFSVAFSRDGTMLSSAAEDGTVKLWSVKAATRTMVTTAAAPGKN